MKIKNRRTGDWMELGPDWVVEDDNPAYTHSYTPRPGTTPPILERCSAPGSGTASATWRQPEAGESREAIGTRFEITGDPGALGTLRIDPATGDWELTSGQIKIEVDPSVPWIDDWADHTFAAPAYATQSARTIKQLIARIQWAHDHGRQWEARTVPTGWEIEIELAEGETTNDDGEIVTP